MVEISKEERKKFDGLFGSEVQVEESKDEKYAERYSQALKFAEYILPSVLYKLANGDKQKAKELTNESWEELKRIVVEKEFDGYMVSLSSIYEYFGESDKTKEGKQRKRLVAKIEIPLNRALHLFRIPLHARTYTSKGNPVVAINILLPIEGLRIGDEGDLEIKKGYRLNEETGEIVKEEAPSNSKNNKKGK